MRREFRFLIQLLFGLILIFAWLKFIDWELLLSYLSQIEFKYVGLMFLFGLVTSLIRFARLKIVLAPLVKVSATPLLAIGWAASLFNFLLAMRAGELTKGYYLKRLYGSSFVRATSAVVVDRVVDFLILVFAVLVISLFRGADLLSPVLLATIFVIPLAALYLLAWKGMRIFSFFESLMLRFNFRWRDQILDIFDNLIKGFAVAKRSPQTLLLIFILTFVSALIDAAGIRFLFMAFGIEMAFLSALLTVSLLTLTFLLPSAPAYIGTVEVAGSAIFILVLGIEKNLAASIAFFLHAYSAFVVGIMGIPAVLYLHLRLLHGKHEARNPKFETSTNAPNSKP